MLLTRFQQNALTELEARLSERRLRFVLRECDSAEVGPHVILECGGVSAYVYTDEAGWMLGEHWQPFERPDFESPERLIGAFVEEVVEVARTGVPPEKSRGTTAVYFTRRHRKNDCEC